ncbi:MAG: hypothetical protein ACRDOI_45535 [Trebonia sp.]
MYRIDESGRLYLVRGGAHPADADADCGEFLIASDPGAEISDYGDVLDGIRLSVTPYAAGWRAADSDPVSQQQFTRDMAAMQATYRPLLDRLGKGPRPPRPSCGSRPLVVTSDLTDTVLDGRHVLACGPHLLISHDQYAGPLPVATVTRLDQRGQPVLSTPGRRYRHLTSDTFADHAADQGLLACFLRASGLPRRRPVHRPAPVPGHRHPPPLRLHRRHPQAPQHPPRPQGGPQPRPPRPDSRSD